MGSLKVKASEYLNELQNLLGDIYKRLLDEQSIMGINTDPTNI